MRVQKGFRALFVTGLAALAVMMIYKSYQVVTADGCARGKEILGRAYEQAAACAMEVYMPQAGYDSADPLKGDLAERILLAVEKHIPGYLGKGGEETTEPEIIEDAATKQAVLEENERLIEKKIAEENQAKIAEEERARAEQEAAAEQERQAQEAAAAAAAQAQQEAQAAPAVVEPIALEQLQDFNYLLNNFFVVDGNTTAEESQINLDGLWGKDMRLEKDGSVPQILIYHTHSQEEFADSVEGDTDTTVIGVGERLAQILRDTYGYQVIHVTDTFDIVDGELDRSKAYDYAAPVIQQVLEENPSIEVVIDLHRDGVDESKHLVTEIDGKPTAQIMFFNGLSRTKRNGEIDYLPNPYIEDNLAFSFQLEYLAKQCYPDFTRCIYLKGYRYNLHVRPRSILLEVGAQTNTVEEAMNAMEPFAKVLNSVLSGTNRTEN